MPHARLALPLTLASLLGGASAAHAIDEFFPGFGNNGYDVRHYNLRLDVDPAARRVEAQAVLTVRATRDLQAFALDLSGLEVTAVAVDGAPARFARDGGKLRVRPAAAIAERARFVVTVAYRGVPDALDDPTTSDPEALELGWLIPGPNSYVVSEPVGASSWYPVNDEPTDKATYRIAVTVPEPYTAVSNGVLRSVADLGPRRRFVWEQAQPMASYLSIVDIDRYKVERLRARDGLPIRLYTTIQTPAATVAAFRRTPEMLAYFEGCAGPYPFSSYGSVVVRDPELYYALETQAMSTFPDRAVSETTVAHELAHQWFGNSATVAEWRDLWLAEGFATYFEYLWEFRDDRPAFNRALRQLYRDTRKDKVGPAVVSRPEDLFAANTYDRGALTLHALRLKVGDTAFFRVLRAFHSAYSGGNATSADFIRLAVAVSGDPGVRDLLRSWLYDEEVPTLPDREEAAMAASEADVPRQVAPLVRRVRR